MGEKLTLDEVQVAPEDAAQIIYDLRRRVKRATEILGKLAPAGTAPRSELERLWTACVEGQDFDTSRLHAWLQPHWGDWPEGGNSSGSD